MTPQSKLLPWEKPYQVRICVLRCELGVLILLNSPRQCFVHALNGLALPTARHARQIALTGSRRLRSTLAAAPALFAHAVVTVATITNMHHAPSIRRALFSCYCVRHSFLFHACNCNDIESFPYCFLSKCARTVLQQMKGKARQASRCSEEFPPRVGHATTAAAA